MSPPDPPPASPDSPGQPDGERPSPSRLDPDLAVKARSAGAPSLPEPIIDTRPYRWTIGVVGILLLVGVSIYMFASHGLGSAGISAGGQLQRFVAPLATSTLNGDANTNPRCDPAHPNPQALNVCGRTKLVLGLFVPGSGDCERQIDTLQTVSTQFPSVKFAAVAVLASRTKALALIRSHHWTIPVAYDKDGAVGQLYGVAICPLVELARPGGVVAGRLIGAHWLSPAALAARVRLLAKSS